MICNVMCVVVEFEEKVLRSLVICGIGDFGVWKSVRNVEKSCEE